MRLLTRRKVLRVVALGATAALTRPAAAETDAVAPLADGVGRDEQRAMSVLAGRFMAEHGVPGLSVAIARNGRTVYLQGFGVADNVTGENVNPSHLFRLASITKTFTSVAIFTLIEEGRLRLSDNVFGKDGILKTEYGKNPYSDWMRAITIEHLLTHTAGGWPNTGRDPALANPRMDHGEVISWALDNVALTSAPGTTFIYSNFGYVLLGRAIEKITGQAYADYVRQAILGRCGITDMRIGGGALAERAPREVRYVALQKQRDPYALNVARLDSCGGWIASARDLVQFAMHVDGRFKVKPLLKPATVSAMTAASAANPH
jgi:CubicO group peptidase (beta-lactamase class C family)